MNTVEEIRHDNLPEDYRQLLRAKVHLYVDETKTELHCFGSLRSAQKFVASFRKQRYRPLNGPAEYENPPARTYLVWTSPGSDWKTG